MYIKACSSNSWHTVLYMYIKSYVGLVVVLAILIALFSYFGKDIGGEKRKNSTEHDAVIHTENVAHDHVALFLEVDPASAPSFSFEVLPDSEAGYNLRLRVENFRFAPENAGQKHIDGEGHAHIYVDEKKIGRIYGDWYHLGVLPPGLHDIRISLNTNDHQTYAVNKEEISVTRIVEVPYAE